MKVTGSATLSAPKSAVWSALQDPAVLVHAIPGCQQLAATGANAYRMTVNAGVASIKGTYIGDVSLADQDPPNGYTLVASGQGAPGTIQAKARVRLQDGDGGSTLLSYDADAVVGGMIGGVGQRVLTGVAKKMAQEFFSAVDRYLAEGPVTAAETAAGAVEAPAAAPGGPPAQAPAGTVYRAPDPVPAPAAGRDLALGAVLGAAISLAGVAIGVLIGRRR
jgi:carbon monoxide dehydrogenase subunit G